MLHFRPRREWMTDWSRAIQSNTAWTATECWRHPCRAGAAEKRAVSAGWRVLGDAYLQLLIFSIDFFPLGLELRFGHRGALVWCSTEEDGFTWVHPESLSSRRLATQTQRWSGLQSACARRELAKRCLGNCFVFMRNGPRCNVSLKKKKQCPFFHYIDTCRYLRNDC